MWRKDLHRWTVNDNMQGFLMPTTQNPIGFLPGLWQATDVESVCKNCKKTKCQTYLQDSVSATVDLSDFWRSCSRGFQDSIIGPADSGTGADSIFILKTSSLIYRLDCWFYYETVYGLNSDVSVSTFSVVLKFEQRLCYNVEKSDSANWTLQIDKF